MSEQKEINVWVILLIGIAVIGLIIGINRGIKNADAKRLQEQEQLRQTRISICEDDAYDVYISNWNKTCAIDGKGDNCTLNLFNKEMLDGKYSDALDRCLVKYAK